MFSDLEKKTYYKYLARRFVTDVYLGKWLRMRSFIRWIEPRLGLAEAGGAKALDLGAGDGILSFYLSGKYPSLDVAGADLDAPQMRASGAVARKLKRDNLNFRVMDVMGGGLPAEAYDYIFTLDMLEHIEDDAAAAVNISGMLKPGGIWTISVPNRLMLTEKGEWVPSLGPPDHVRTGYDLDALEAIVRAAGLEILFHRYYTGPKMIPAWRLFSGLDRVGRPLTLIGMPFYKLCFSLEPDAPPSSGNAFFLVALKPSR